MRTSFIKVACLAAMVAAVACSGQTTDSDDDVEATAQNNILLAEWSGPYGGVPPFDKMEHCRPQAGAGRPPWRCSWKRSTPSPATPNRPPSRTRSWPWSAPAEPSTGSSPSTAIWRSNVSTPESREMQAEMAPKLAEFGTKITQNAELFARIKAVYESEETKRLRPDQQRLV